MSKPVYKTKGVLNHTNYFFLVMESFRLDSKKILVVLILLFSVSTYAGTSIESDSMDIQELDASFTADNITFSNSEGFERTVFLVNGLLDRYF